jgi:hypothetical protein
MFLSGPAITSLFVAYLRSEVGAYVLPLLNTNVVTLRTARNSGVAAARRAARKTRHRRRAKQGAR